MEMLSNKGKWKTIFMYENKKNRSHLPPTVHSPLMSQRTLHPFGALFAVKQSHGHIPQCVNSRI